MRLPPTQFLRERFSLTEGKSQYLVDRNLLGFLSGEVAKLRLENEELHADESESINGLICSIVMPLQNAVEHKCLPVSQAGSFSLLGSALSCPKKSITGFCGFRSWVKSGNV